MKDIFISYPHTESVIADSIKSRLEDEFGIHVWLDTELRAGEDWKESIDSHIQDALAVILLMSDDAKKSEYVTYEWAYALGQGVTVVPIVVKQMKKKLHPVISRLQYIDMVDRGPGKNQIWLKLRSQISELVYRNRDENVRFLPPDAPKSADTRHIIDQLNSHEADIRKKAIKRLWRKKWSITLLKQLIILDSDKGVRKAAATALGKTGGDDAREILIDILKSGSDHIEVRQYAANALKNFDKYGTVGILRNLMSQEKSDTVKQAIIKTLDSIK